MQVGRTEPYSFKGRLYLNRNDLRHCKTISYEELKNDAKGQVIESPRKGGFVWVRLEGPAEKNVINKMKNANMLFCYLPGDISYTEFENFAHSNW